jgi:hypothetical protein
MLRLCLNIARDLGTCRFLCAAFAGVKLNVLPFEGRAPVQDGSGQWESLPLKPQHEVLPDYHRPSSGGVDRPAAGEANHLPRKLRCRDAARPARGGDVAVVPRHGVCDADPGGGSHVAAQGDVAGPRLIGDVPPDEVLHRDDVLEADGGLQGRGAVQTEVEVVQSRPELLKCANSSTVMSPSMSGKAVSNWSS